MAGGAFPRREVVMLARLLPRLLIVALLVLAGCGKDGDTGPQGPQGLQGTDGPEGPIGPAGPDGSVAFVFQDGGGPTATYDGTRDSYIDSSQPGLNFGHGLSYLAMYPGQIQAGHAVGSYAVRGLIRFDVSEIAALQGTVTSAYLVLYAGSCGGLPTIGAYELLNSWDEGTGDGTTSGYANWASPHFFEPWTAGGGDYAPALLDSESMSLGFPKRPAGGELLSRLRLLEAQAFRVEDVPKYCVFRIPASVAQKWIDEPDENYGLLLKSVDESIPWGEPGGGAALFTGREWTTGSQRPKLIVLVRLP
jgi:hypothetical protein